MGVLEVGQIPQNVKSSVLKSIKELETSLRALQSDYPSLENAEKSVDRDKLITEGNQQLKKIVNKSSIFYN